MPDPPNKPQPQPPDPAAASFPTIGDNPQYADADDTGFSTLHTRLDDDADPEEGPDDIDDTQQSGQNVLSGKADTNAPTQAMDEAPTAVDPGGDDEGVTVAATQPAPRSTPPSRQPSTEQDLVAAYIGAGLFAPGDTKVKPLALLAGRYAITKLIGRGGMGVVFLASDRHADCNVAVKTIHPRYLNDADAKQGFIEEARQMARIPSHASVLVVKDVSDASLPFYTMEFMPNGSLGRLIRERGALDRETVLRLSRTIAKAIDYVHVSAGAIHRDIKPENVLLAEDGTARLCDFGLIRRVGSGAVGLRAGTVAYMPPEVVTGGGKNVGFEWDIYSMGALLYEMLTGKPPYAEAIGSGSGSGSDRVQALKQAIKDNPPRPILTLNKKADRGLVAIAQWAMARNKRERYVQVADLLADLERVAKGTKPLGPQQQKRSGSAKQRRLGAVVIVAALLVGLGYGAFTLFGPGVTDSATDNPDPTTDNTESTTRNGQPQPENPGAAAASPAIPATGLVLLDQTNPSPAFAVQAATVTGQTHFVDGEPLHFVIGPADTDCHLAVLLYSVGTDDPPVQLYPNPYQPEQRLAAGATIRVPDATAIANRYQAIVEPPYSPVLLKVIATREPIRLTGLDTQSPQVFAGSGDVKMGASVSDVLGIEDWTTTELLITTGPPGSTAPTP